MLIQKGFKFKLLPNKEQEQKLLQHGGNARFIWNLFLKQNIDHYKLTSKFKFYHELATSLPKLKEDYPFLKESFSQSLQSVAKKFDSALKSSFKTKKSFPVFKKKSTLNDSFACPQKWRLGKGFVFIPKVGEVKWVKHRPFQGKPKNITISQDGDKWYCSVLCEYKIQEQEMKSDNVVGVDVGLKKFVVLSDNTTISNPKYLKRTEKKLVRAQRRLSKKKKGSRNRFKQQIRVRKIHTKIKNTRRDFLHKTTSSMIAKYDGFVLEDLNVAGMMRNHKLAKSITDVSWSEFGRQLEYKSRWNFKHFLRIDRFYPSSKTCSRCGNVQNMPLSKRLFNCSECGLLIDRDYNASINIKELGLNTLGRREIKACGESSIGVLGLPETRYGLMKQEKECLVN